MALKCFPWVYYMIICQVGPPWGHLGTHGGPKTAPKWPRMAQNHHNGSKWHCMTPNDPKTLPMGIIHDNMSCWNTRALFRGPLGPCGPRKRPQGGPIRHIIMYYAPEKCFRAIWCHAGIFWVMKRHFGSKKAILVLFSDKAPGCSNMT